MSVHHVHVIFFPFRPRRRMRRRKKLVGTRFFLFHSQEFSRRTDNRTGPHALTAPTRSEGQGPPVSRGQRRAGNLCPPARLKHVLHKAYLHLGDLPPDPLGVSHLRRSCELLRMVLVERPGARARPPVNGAVAPARSLRPLRQAPNEVKRVGRDAPLCPRSSSGIS